MDVKDHFSHWEIVRDGLMRTIDTFREEEIEYKPFENSWSVGEILLHIANSEDGWLRYGVLHETREWPSGHTLKNYPTFDSIRSLLTEVHSQTHNFLASIEIDELDRMIDMPWNEHLSIRTILWHLIEHEIHHRGELSLILGILGRKGLDV